MTTEQMNGDIAEYMGAEFRTDYNDYYFEDHPSLIIRGRWACEVEKMYYHNSFDWLMPVWQKLRSELSELITQNGVGSIISDKLEFYYSAITNAITEEDTPTTAHKLIYEAIQLIKTK